MFHLRLVNSISRSHPSFFSINNLLPLSPSFVWYLCSATRPVKNKPRRPFWRFSAHRPFTCQKFIVCYLCERNWVIIHSFFVVSGCVNVHRQWTGGLIDLWSDISACVRDIQDFTYINIAQKRWMSSGKSPVMFFFRPVNVKGPILSQNPASIFHRVACVPVNFCDKILHLMPLMRWFGILGNILICFLEESNSTPMSVVSAHSPP